MITFVLFARRLLFLGMEVYGCDLNLGVKFLTLALRYCRLFFIFFV